jgi:hypothetical protein
MSADEAIRRAITYGKRFGLPFAVVHAPAELANDPTGPYDCCPVSDVDSMFPCAVNGLGLDHCPARGVLRIVLPDSTNLEPPQRASVGLGRVAAFRARGIASLRILCDFRPCRQVPEA